MFILCVKPASSQADRALAAVQDNLFAQTASPAFLALPPHAVVDVSAGSPHVHLLDAIPRIDAGAGEPESDSPAVGRIVADGRKLYYLPHPRNRLTTLWNLLAGAIDAEAGMKRTLTAQKFGAPRPALYLGELVADADVDAVHLDESLLEAVGAIRSYAIAVIQVESGKDERWWEQVRWTMVYERELGHRERRSERR